MLIDVSLSKDLVRFARFEIKYRDMPSLLCGDWSWSACHFRDDYRSSHNWIASSQSVLVFDFDFFTKNFEKFFGQFFCLVCTTKSHKKMKNGIISERYRAIFPLVERFTSNITPTRYSEIYLFFAEKFGADLSCKDVARKWDANSGDNFEFWFFEGEKIDWRIVPEKNEEKKRVFFRSKKNFLDERHWERMFKPSTIVEGNRHNSFVRIALWARDEGCCESECSVVLDWLNERISCPLPRKEVERIKKSLYKK